MSGRDTDKFRQQAIDTANLLLKAADIIENPDPSRPTSAHNHGAENLSDRSRPHTSVVGMWRKEGNTSRSTSASLQSSSSRPEKQSSPKAKKSELLWLEEEQ